MIRHLPMFFAMVFLGTFMAFVALNWLTGCGEGGVCLWEDVE